MNIGSLKILKCFTIGFPKPIRLYSNRRNNVKLIICRIYSAPSIELKTSENPILYMFDLSNMSKANAIIPTAFNIQISLE